MIAASLKSNDAIFSDLSSLRAVLPLYVQLGGGHGRDRVAGPGREQPCRLCAGTAGMEGQAGSVDAAGYPAGGAVRSDQPTADATGGHIAGPGAGQQRADADALLARYALCLSPRDRAILPAGVRDRDGAAVAGNVEPVSVAADDGAQSGGSAVDGGDGAVLQCAKNRLGRGHGLCDADHFD
ncbi:hypothetical protein E4T56_gene15724, partial [Termitomyces sp. T112]